MKKLSNYLFLFLLFCFLSGLQAQDDIPVWKKLRYLSEEEMTMQVRSALDFVETDPPEGLIRNVAEFDPMQAVLVRYPFGVPVTVMKEIAEDIELITIVANSTQENEVRSIYTSNEVNLENCTFIYAPTNSWWVRDYGPWFVFDGNYKPGIVDFPYNRPRPKDNDIPAAVAAHLGIDLYGMNILHTGGNYMTDGLGKSSSTDLIEEENPGLSGSEIDDKLRDYLAIDEYYVLEDPLDDYIKHIDCWGKFLNPGKVIIGQVAENDYRYHDFEAAASFFANTNSSYGIPYEVFRVFTPGQSQTTPYTNSLIVNNKVLVPISGSSWDDEAIEAYEQALPGYKIVGIYYNGWYNTDALHCRSKGVADLDMLYLKHMPVLGQRSYLPELDFHLELNPYSGEAVYQDSVFFIYSINDHPFDTLTFNQDPTGDWLCTLDGLSPEDRVRYFLQASDHSGRTSRHPYIGSADPHEFQLGSFVTELSVDPDTLYFNTEEQLVNGLGASIFNNQFSPTIISEIQAPQNSNFELRLDDLPDLPFELGATSNLNFNIGFNEPIPGPGSLIVDSIMVKTAFFSYPLIFKIDREGVSTNDIRSENDLSVFPNPVLAGSHVNFYPIENGEAEVSIYDSFGNKVFQDNQSFVKGKQNLLWNLNDRLGNQVIPGIYFYSIKGNEGVKSGTLLVK